MSGRTVVLGVGNAMRGDDRAGLLVLERLRGRVPEAVLLVECEQEPTRLLDAWRGAGEAFVVDACASGQPAGTVHLFDATEEQLPARTFRSSTHAFGVGDAVELARVLAQLPGRVSVYGIEGGDFAAGAPVTPAVEEAAAQVADAIAAALAEGRERCTSAP